MALSEDFARTVNHDLGYDGFAKSMHTPNDYSKHRVTKFDVLKLLSESKNPE